MAYILYLSFYLVLHQSTLALSVTEKPLPDNADQEFIDSCVKEHNTARINTNPPASDMRYMTWDDDLAQLASSWAIKCLFEHNPTRTHPVLPSVGENIWAGTPPSLFRVKSAIKNWVDEVKGYNYDTTFCSKDPCGHYTQVVWAASFKVGCAVIGCPDGVRNTQFSHLPGAIYVCNYATAGNYAGVRPYKQGRPCRECSGETCLNKLCHNPARDGIIRDNWTPDWDPALHACGAFCKAVLIIRPIALLLIFGSVYLVQRRCPNIFAYIN